MDAFDQMDAKSNGKRKTESDEYLIVKPEPTEDNELPSPSTPKKLKLSPAGDDEYVPLGTLNNQPDPGDENVQSSTRIKKQGLESDSEDKYLVKDEIDASSESDSPLASSSVSSKKSRAKKKRGGGGAEVLVTADGEQYIELGPRRRTTVRRYNGQTLIDIREFYEQDGEKKPGKKGLSLTLDQWKRLRKSVDLIDAMIAEAS